MADSSGDGASDVHTLNRLPEHRSGGDEAIVFEDFHSKVRNDYDRPIAATCDNRTLLPFRVLKAIALKGNHWPLTMIIASRLTD